MLQRDYLMRLISMFIEAVQRSWLTAKVNEDPKGAADSLEALIGEATDIDGALLLALEPESIASVMQVSGVDPAVTEQIARSLLLESHYLALAEDDELAQLRADQARGIADAYGIDLPTLEELTAQIAAASEEGVDDGAGVLR